MFNEPIRNYPNNVQLKWISLPKFPNKQSTEKLSYIFYFETFLKWNLLSSYHRRKLCFWSNVRSVLLTWQFGGVSFFKASQVFYILVYSSNYLGKNWQTILFFRKKYGKHDEHTMIMLWFMTTMTRNMAAMPSSGHDHEHVSPWSWYGHGMAAMFFQSALASHQEVLQ